MVIVKGLWKCGERIEFNWLKVLFSTIGGADLNTFNCIFIDEKIIYTFSAFAL